MSSKKKSLTKLLFSFDITRHKFLRKYAQLIYAAILIILIPIIIIFNTFYVIDNFRDDIDEQMRRQAVIITTIFDASHDNIDNPAAIQKTLDNLLALTIDENISIRDIEELRSIDILAPNGDDFVIIASHEKSNIGEVIHGTNNILAWHEDRAVAHLTRPSAKDINQFPELAGQRYWNTIVPIHSQDGEKIAMLNMKMSLKYVDYLTQNTLVASTGILLLALLIILLLLIVNTRLFGYAFMVNKLKEVDQMKDEFISMASHELRTPITAINGYVSMFIDGSFGTLSEAGGKGINIINLSIKRLANLVEDLLNVSRIEQGRLEYDLKEVELNAVIEQTISELKIQADEKHLQLEYAKPESEKTVKVDRDRLRQVLVNIIGNSIKYTPEGSVTVSIDDEEKLIKVRIKDTGIGMSAKDREQLFTKFYRVKSEMTQKIVGTGLGLWITKQIVEQMGGEIFVDSIEGSGTEISFTLPKPSSKSKNN